MCTESEGVSVWFACKLCKSFFLNADDFAYHKKKSHLEEFGNTKFIVFEEQTTPTASPPENWVTFLSPKDEIQVHRIISLTNVEYDLSANNNTQSNRNEEFIEIDSERNKIVCNDHDYAISNDADQLSNNCFELNFDVNSNYDFQNPVNNVQEMELLQTNTAPTATANSDLTDEKRDKHSSPVTNSVLKSKTRSLKRSKQIVQNVPSKKALQTVVPSPKNPYVNLKRLNLITLQNASSSPSSNSTKNTQDNCKSNPSHIDNSNANTAKESKPPHGDPEKFHGLINCRITSPPPVTFETCKFCSKHFHSTAELDIHEDICSLKRQFENIICAPCLLTFGSSDELIAHNRTFHSTSFSTSASADVTDKQTEFVDAPEVAPKTEIKPESCYALSNNQAQSNMVTNHPLATNYEQNNSQSDNQVWEGKIIYEAADNKLNISLGSSTSSSSENIIVPENGPLSGSEPITQVNFSFGELILKTVKTDDDDDDIPCGNEDSEFPVVNQDPTESVSSRLEEAESAIFAEQTSNVSESSSSPSNSHGNQEPRKLVPQIDFALRCFTCERSFITIQELYDHNKNHHMTLEGDRNTSKTTSSTSEKMMSGRTTLSKEQQEIYDDLKRRSPDQQCVVCGSKYKKNAIRNRHILIVHVQTNRNKIPCTAHVGCRYKASTKGDMKKHLKGRRVRERVPVAGAVQSLLDEVDDDSE